MMLMKGCMQWNSVYSWNDFSAYGLEPWLLAEQASFKPTELTGILSMVQRIPIYKSIIIFQTKQTNGMILFSIAM